MYIDILCVYTSVDLPLYSDSVRGQCRSAIGPQGDGQRVFSMHLFFYMLDRDLATVALASYELQSNNNLEVLWEIFL